MGYAMRNDGMGWRAVSGPNDPSIAATETYSDVQPQPLQMAQAAQIATLTTAYQNAIQIAVSFTSAGGVTKTFQADKNSQDNLAKMLDAYRGTGIAPIGFYWVAADNTQVPFTYADMQGLAAAMGAQGWTAFQHLQTQKAAVNTATTVAQVQSIVW